MNESPNMKMALIPLFRELGASFGLIKFKNQIYQYQFGGPVKNQNRKFRVYFFFNANNPVFFDTKQYSHQTDGTFFSLFYQIHSRLMAVFGKKIDFPLKRSFWHSVDKCSSQNKKCSSEQKWCSSKFAHLKKRCSSGLLIRKKNAHLACSSETLCSSDLLIYEQRAHLFCSSLVHFYKSAHLDHLILNPKNFQKSNKKSKFCKIFQSTFVKIAIFTMLVKIIQLSCSKN